MSNVEGKIDRRDFLKKALLGTGLALTGVDLINQIEVLSEPIASHFDPEYLDCDRGLCDAGSCKSGICGSGICKDGTLS